MLARLIVRQEVGQVAGDKGAELATHFAAQIDEQLLHHLLGDTDLFAADLAVHVRQRSLALDHLVALPRKAKQGEGQEVPLDRRAEADLIFPRDVIPQIIARKVGHAESLAAVAGLP